MTNQQEDRPLSIGVCRAVHPQGKNNPRTSPPKDRAGAASAKVVDTEERTWRVPESALKHSGGARLATIVTRHDKARADYRVGDEVTFTSPDGPKAWRDREAQPEERQRYATKRHAGTSPMDYSAGREGKARETARRG